MKTDLNVGTDHVSRQVCVYNHMEWTGSRKEKKDVPANSLHHHNETGRNGNILESDNVLRDHEGCLSCKAHAYTVDNLVPNPSSNRNINVECGQKTCSYRSEDRGCRHERPDVASGCDAKAARDGCYRLRNYKRKHVDSGLDWITALASLKPTVSLNTWSASDRVDLDSSRQMRESRAGESFGRDLHRDVVSEEIARTSIRKSEQNGRDNASLFDHALRHHGVVSNPAFYPNKHNDQDAE